MPPGALAMLDKLSGAIEQTAEYLDQRGATVAAIGGNPTRSRRPLRAGRRGRPQSPRRPVRPGPGKRPPRQRRHGHGALQAGRRPLPLAHRLADEPGPAVRRPRAVRPGRPVLPAGAGRLSRSPPGGLVLQGHRGLARAVLRRGRAEETRPHEPGAQHPGDRLRAFRPQPQLPAEDGHQDPGRPLPLHRGRTAGQQELRRNQPRRDQGDAGLEGAAAGAIGRRTPGRRGLRAGDALAPTSRPCWPSPSPI